ncbi:hypothetical protein [Halegenticoccus soli]|uniref:hypothetical protein n=1 Tax=Halegenticoccus soli TaxID=1985678 RepID=UPI000C6DD8C2|nr:hypothetical protein [Halegenticoccus soli]
MVEETREKTEAQATRTEAFPSSTGWTFFSERTTRAQRRRYLAHALVYALGLSLVVWPGVLPFNRVEPLVLGLPFVFFWTAASLVIVLVNSLLLYRFEYGSFLG